MAQPILLSAWCSKYTYLQPCRLPTALQMDNYREDGGMDREKWCSGWGAEGIENNKTSLITVGYRGLIRLPCHIVIKHMGVVSQDVTLTDYGWGPCDSNALARIFSIDKESWAPDRSQQVCYPTCSSANELNHPHTHNYVLTFYFKAACVKCISTVMFSEKSNLKMVRENKTEWSSKIHFHTS